MNHHLARVLACALAFCTSTAIAGTLASDGSALDGTWHGTASFQGYYTDPVTHVQTPSGLTGTIDYAVYTAPQFTQNFPAFGLNFVGTAYVPTSLYVYVYQAFETGPAPLSSVSIGLTIPLPFNPGDNAPAVDIGTFVGTDLSPLSNGGTIAGQIPAPGTDLLVPYDSSTWTFGSVLVSQGGSTAGLVFSSEDAPIMRTGSTINDDSVALTGPLPTPGVTSMIPEPATMALAISGLATIAVYRVLRHRRRD